MKKIGLTVWTLTVLTFGCQPTNTQEDTQNSDSISISRNEITKDIENEISIDTISKIKDFDKFETIFEYVNEEQRILQKLGVTWLTTDSIEFRLYSINDICDTGFWGNAKNYNPDMNTESQDNENSESDLTYEYKTEEEIYSLKILISLDKNIAKIIFDDKTGEDTDCIPTPDLTLIRINAR